MCAVEIKKYREREQMGSIDWLIVIVPVIIILGIGKGNFDILFCNEYEECKSIREKQKNNLEFPRDPYYKMKKIKQKQEV